MKTLYASCNAITEYQTKDRSPEWRLIILESFVGGVPGGMLAVSFCHCHSLFTLQRDQGSICNFLEQAENERIYLIAYLKMFNFSSLTKALVFGAQPSMTQFLMLIYMISLAAMHCFDGYLEGNAVETYENIVN